jgi:hypothetical protein
MTSQPGARNFGNCSKISKNHREPSVPPLGGYPYLILALSLTSLNQLTTIPNCSCSRYLMKRQTKVYVVGPSYTMLKDPIRLYRRQLVCRERNCLRPVLLMILQRLRSKNPNVSRRHEIQLAIYPVHRPQLHECLAGEIWLQTIHICYRPNNRLVHRVAATAFR